MYICIISIVSSVRQFDRRFTNTVFYKSIISGVISRETHAAVYKRVLAQKLIKSYTIDAIGTLYIIETL